MYIVENEQHATFNDKMRNDLKPKQISVFYDCEEIKHDFDISMFNIYNYSTIASDINYMCK